MTLHERWIGDVTIIDIDGRITVQDGGTSFAIWSDSSSARAE